ncbi:hypothetical protein CF326_g5604 [Tilletia indica]|nr:hypothetical protein CF326_g5604 [Tilletia indica]
MRATRSSARQTQQHQSNGPAPAAASALPVAPAASAPVAEPPAPVAVSPPAPAEASPKSPSVSPLPAAAARSSAPTTSSPAAAVTSCPPAPGTSHPAPAASRSSAAASSPAPAASSPATAASRSPAPAASRPSAAVASRPAAAASRPPAAAARSTAASRPLTAASRPIAAPARPPAAASRSTAAASRPTAAASRPPAAAASRPPAAAASRPTAAARSTAAAASRSPAAAVSPPASASDPADSAAARGSPDATSAHRSDSNEGGQQRGDESAVHFESQHDSSRTGNAKEKPRWTEMEQREIAAALGDLPDLQRALLPGKKGGESPSYKIKQAPLLNEVIDRLRAIGSTRKMTEDTVRNKIRHMTAEYIKVRDLLSETGQSKTADEIRGNSRLEKERAEQCRGCHFFEAWHEIMLDRRSQPPPRIRTSSSRATALGRAHHQADAPQAQRMDEDDVDEFADAFDDDNDDDGLRDNEEENREGFERGQGPQGAEDAELSQEEEEGDAEESQMDKGKQTAQKSASMEDVNADAVLPSQPSSSSTSDIQESSKRKRPVPSKPDPLREMSALFERTSEAAEARRERWDQEQRQRAEESARREKAEQARHEEEMDVRRQEAGAQRSMANAILALVHSSQSNAGRQV